MDTPTLRKPRTAIRVWTGVLAAFVCALATGEFAVMHYGDTLRRARPEMYLEEAVKYKNAGDFPNAMASWRKAEERGPEEPRVYKVLGDIHHRMENWEPAIVAYREALRLGSDAPGVRLNLLACYLNLEQYDDVVAAGERFLEEPDPDPAYYRYVATACFRGKRYEEAIPYLQAALEGYPNDAYLMDQLRQSYLRLGRSAAAEAVDAKMRELESQLQTISGETPDAR